MIVANHPFGIGDGIAVLSLAEQLGRPFRVMIAAELLKIREMEPYSLPVDFSETKEALKNNLAVRHEAVRLLKQGVTIVVFPAGGVATAPNGFGEAEDLPWKIFPARLIQEAKASVVPMHFPGQNGRLFHLVSRPMNLVEHEARLARLVGKVSLTLRLSLLVREFARLVRQDHQRAHRPHACLGGAGAAARPQGTARYGSAEAVFDLAPPRSGQACAGSSDALPGESRIAGSPAASGSCAASRRLRSRRPRWLRSPGPRLPGSAADDGEIALVDAVAVLGDDRVVAFRQHHRGEGADAFADRIAGSGQDRPRRVGDRLAARLAHQLHGQFGGVVLDGRLGQLAGLDPDVGADDGVDRTIGRHDVIGAGVQPDHRVGADVGDDQRALAVGFGLGLVDRKAQLVRRNANAAGKHGVELQAAGVEHQVLAPAFAADRDALGGAGAAERGVDEIAAGLELEDAGAALRGGDERQFAVRSRRRA